MKTTTELQDKLQQFYGSETFYFLPLLNHFEYSEGAKYFFQNVGQCGAYWLGIDLATEFYKHLDDDFYVVELKVNDDHAAILTARTDIGEPVKYQKEYNYTDIEPNETPYKFYANVYKNQNYSIKESVMRFYLPSEY